MNSIVYIQIYRTWNDEESFDAFPSWIKIKDHRSYPNRISFDCFEDMESHDFGSFVSCPFRCLGPFQSHQA